MFMFQDSLRTLVLHSVKAYVAMVDAAAISTMALDKSFKWTKSISLSDFQ